MRPAPVAALRFWPRSGSALGLRAEDGVVDVVEDGDSQVHLFVLLGYRDIRLADVEAELARRFGISGLDEKAARNISAPQG